MADVTKEDPKERTRLRMKEWRKQNREKLREYQRKWVFNNAESVKEYQKLYSAEYRAQPDKQFEAWLRNLRRYNLTPSSFNELWAAQEGKCAVCDGTLLPRGREKMSACIDHNHETGEVRGLLCRQCNAGIGHFQDSPALMKSAVGYLKKRGHFGK